MRAALIEAGLAAIAEDESADVSLRDLARRVGVSPSAAYRHFASKDELLAALAAEGFRRLGAAGSAAGDPGIPPAERLRTYGRAYVDFALRNPALFHLMFGGRIAPGASEEYQVAGDAAFGQLLGGVAAATGLDPRDPRVAVGTASSWALVHGLASLILDGQLQRFAPDPVRLVDAVLAGAALNVADPGP